MGLKLLTYDEVSKHNTRSDLWMNIKGKVYDISKFLDDYPEDEEILLSEISKNGTSAFENMGLSKQATKAISKYQIGRIDAKSNPNAPKTLEEQAAGSSWRAPIAISILVVYIAFLFHLFRRQFP